VAAYAIFAKICARAKEKNLVGKGLEHMRAMVE
jgi:hypothetical protein